jgi:hypothetical protein
MRAEVPLKRRVELDSSGTIEANPAGRLITVPRALRSGLLA